MTIYAAADYFTCVIESVMMFMLYGTFLRKRESLPRWVYAAGAALLALLITISNKFSGNGIIKRRRRAGLIFCGLVSIPRKHEDEGGNIGP